MTLPLSQVSYIYLMNRKKFLASAVGLGAFASAAASGSSGPVAAVVPAYLKPGDIIGITSPAGYITEEDIAPAVEQMKSWGFRIKTGAAIGRRYFTFGGTDEERAQDLQNMLDDRSLSAIMCARGGYGMVRIIDQLDFTQFAKHPKWIIGFSDVTVLHAHLNKNFGIASVHSKMCNSFPDKWNDADQLQKDTILSIRNALTGSPMKYAWPPSGCNKPGIAEGELVGGNLKTIETLAGSASDLYTNGKILFVEDTGEYLYSIDRMFWNLKRTGKLVGLKGLIVGGFKIKPDDPGEEFGIVLEDIVLGKLKDHSFPVCFDFPAGHQKNNFALKCGVRHRLEVAPANCLLEEIK
jgi:muramoyltetrapeptide carboxypeptidase